MSNRFYTILIVPEKPSQVRRLIVPSWLIKGASAGLAFVALLTCAMLFDYWYVMSQIGENKQLKLENRRLRQQVQIFQNKITTVESTMERVKTFATRLKVIMHVEDHAPSLQSKLPDANSNINASNSTLGSAANLANADSTADQLTPDPEKKELLKEYSQLENRISKLNTDAFETEEQLQDEYEILYDKKAFLAALPTRQPAPGYFTSGFGIRTSPIGDRVKMHEGLDIANRLGTFIRAPADGDVTFADSKAGYGMTLVLNHGYGIETLYGHLKGFVAKKGDNVKRGTKIAILGNTGRSTGPHVHYEVRVHGYPVDPRSYIFEDSSP
jgi:murein DD-endopeptidase MepM/ murein hydrolase activator NlpD